MTSFLIKIFLLVFCISNIGCFKKKEIKQSRFPANELGGSQSGNVPSRGYGRVSNLGVSLPVDGQDFSQRCRAIISERGNPGPTGRALIAAMRRVERSKKTGCFFGGGREVSNLGKHCKGERHFNSLSRTQKESLWLWFWASLAQIESNCNMDARYNGLAMNNRRVPMVYGGLYQLPTNSVHREYENTRFCPEGADVFTVSFQANCAVSRFADLHCGEDPIRDVDVMEYPDFTRQWVSMQSITAASRRLRRLIQMHPLCSE